MTEALLKAWVGSSFEQIMRVNATETSVRNRCELTVVLSGPKALTFSAGEGASAESVGWKSGSGQSGDLSVASDCGGVYPCNVTATWRSTLGDGARARCSIFADDAASRVIGTSHDNALDIAGPPTHAAIACCQRTRPRERSLPATRRPLSGTALAKAGRSWAISRTTRTHRRTRARRSRAAIAAVM